ncbi:MAG: heme-binding domain-containing protein [Anaerolineae bacterium]|nr:heme-binding domain-containing protein [Anaerolineae bacterium]
MNRLKALFGTRKQTFGIIVAALVVIFLVIQLIPAETDNPPVETEMNWDSDRTRELVQDACFDCHSNETDWPWYSKIAPVKWLVSYDVQHGRDRMNFSDWLKKPMGPGQIEEVVNEGEMPPWIYRIMHPEARLSDQEKEALIEGLRVTILQSD